jgi:nicotinic acid mononucleotide adenylyltransferase
MAQELSVTLTTSPFKEIWAEAEFYLDLIASHLNQREITPVAITGSENEAERAAFSRVFRIGVFPVSADPFHWAHLLIGLSAIARFKLNKIVYVISGCDARKPEITSPTIRHPMGRSILNLFTPLFDYSSAALEGDLDGESSLFKILASHQARRINAFYIAGADHCRRFDPGTGGPDTVQKMEEHVRRKTYGFDRKKHRISMIFVKRGVAKCSVDTRLDVSCMPGVPFEASSSAIRRALAGREKIDRFALLPYTAYLYIRALGLYASERQVEPSHGPLRTKRVA